MHNLQTKINELMTEKKISAVDIEKATGLNRNTVYSIITGNSRNPSAHNLQLIAKALDVSLDSILIGEREFKTAALNKVQLAAFANATSTTISIIIEKDINLPLDKIIALIKEVYQYSIKLDPPCIDERFVHWLLDKYKN